MEDEQNSLNDFRERMNLKHRSPKPRFILPKDKEYTKSIESVSLTP